MYDRANHFPLDLAYFDYKYRHSFTRNAVLIDPAYVEYHTRMLQKKARDFWATGKFK